MSNRNLLVELFVEELPPKALKKIGDAFAQTLQASLKTQGLLADDSVLTHFASPRRLGVHLTQVDAQADDKLVMQKLMPVAVGLTADGKATPALLKKLAALGTDESAVAELKRESDGKTEVLFFNSVLTGATLAEGLQKAIEEAMAKLPIPKVMAYQLADGWETVHFVRPAHGLVALHGADIVPVSVLGLTAGNTTHGHRFEAGLDPVFIRHADTYAAQLATEGAVIASFDERRAEIVRQLAAAATKAGSTLTPIEDTALLDEVTGLVERPNVLIGQFEEVFLEVPQECLILTMKANQKYFPLLDSAGNLSNKFLIVSNIRPADPSTVIGGNERVVRPRLADAKFFFDQDRKKTLESRLAGLDKVVYHNKLGTQAERTRRVQALAGKIAKSLAYDVALAERGALLAKADLLTDMVGEFPELQGIMGTYYARHDGEHEEVAQAASEHYQPRFAGDALPATHTGIAVALADKLETLVGIWGIGLQPTGDRDPFALRRHALGILRMLVEKRLPLSLAALLRDTASLFSGNSNFKDPGADVSAFLFDRLRGLLRERGYAQNEIEAVVAQQPDTLANIIERLDAVQIFAALPEAASLAAANKRITNILKKAEGVTGKVEQGLLQEASEQSLHAAIASLKPKVEASFAAGDFAATLKALAQLRNDVDAFFDNVMVNAEDAALRKNRLALLADLHGMLNQVADISKLAA